MECLPRELCGLIIEYLDPKDFFALLRTYKDPQMREILVTEYIREYALDRATGSANAYVLIKLIILKDEENIERFANKMHADLRADQMTSTLQCVSYFIRDDKSRFLAKTILPIITHGFYAKLDPSCAQYIYEYIVGNMGFIPEMQFITNYKFQCFNPLSVLGNLVSASKHKMTDAQVMITVKFFKDSNFFDSYPPVLMIPDSHRLDPSTLVLHFGEFLDIAVNGEETMLEMTHIIKVLSTNKSNINPILKLVVNSLKNINVKNIWKPINFYTWQPLSAEEDLKKRCDVRNNFPNNGHFRRLLKTLNKARERLGSDYELDFYNDVFRKI